MSICRINAKSPQLKNKTVAGGATVGVEWNFVQCRLKTIPCFFQLFHNLRHSTTHVNAMTTNATFMKYAALRSGSVRVAGSVAANVR